MSSTTLGTSYTSGTGIDVTGTVDSILYTERAVERAWQKQQSTISTKSQALQNIQSTLETLSNTVNTLKSYTGPFAAQVAQSSDSTVVTASSDGSAAAGVHTIIVTNTATISTVYSDVIPQNTVFSDSAFVFSVGGVDKSVAIDSTNNTLSGLVSSINSGDYGVTASVVQDANGQRLALVSKTSGLDGAIVAGTALSGIQFHQGIEAQNAHATVDGVPVESSTNEITGVIAGLTLNLASAKPASAVTITVGADVSQAKQAITSFVNAYNTVIGAINQQFTYNSTSNTAGPLAGDAGLRTVQSVLLSQLGFSFDDNSDVKTMKSLGIDMSNDGTLSINNTNLTSALNSKFGQVKSFFQDPTSGFAVKLGATMMSLTSSTEGALSVEITGLSEQNSALSDQIDAFETRLETRRKSLLDEYSRIDTSLRQLPTLLDQITAQLGTTSKK